VDKLLKPILQYPIFLITSFARMANRRHSSVCFTRTSLEEKPRHCGFPAVLYCVLAVSVWSRLS
jgi:hypothetical protein